MAEPITNSRHASLAELDAGFRSLAPPPRNIGRLLVIVCRRADGGRDTLETAVFSPVAGVCGDGGPGPRLRDPDAQITVMRHDVAELIACGQPLTTFGDDLFVDLDISAENLPAGTQLEIGDAIVEVTPKAHNGCSKFQARFGADAVRFVHAPHTRNQNLRGIYWRVIKAGEVHVGSTIRVIRD